MSAQEEKGMRVHSLQDTVGRLSVAVTAANGQKHRTHLDAQFGTIPMCCGTKASDTPPGEQLGNPTMLWESLRLSLGTPGTR